jgi:hypothetical protein
MDQWPKNCSVSESSLLVANRPTAQFVPAVNDMKPPVYMILQLAPASAKRLSFGSVIRFAIWQSTGTEAAGGRVQPQPDGVSARLVQGKIRLAT